MQADDTSNLEQLSTEQELSHTDKIVGVFSEPTKMFSMTSLFPPRTKDWIIPLLIVFALLGILRSVAMLNEEVFFHTKQEATNRIEEMVKNGTIPPDQLDSALERSDQQMEFMRGPIGWVINIVSTLIFGSIFFFIIVAIYFLFVKFLLKGEGNYQSAIVASALPMYISAVQFLIGGILTFMMGKMIMDTSVASLTGSDKSTIVGWLLAKIDPFSIWAYFVLSIGLAKMFKSQSTTKYFLMVFGLWIVGGLLIWFIATAVPFLSFLNM
jgi:hypothetical protein